mmetsp:Transcript_13601/g.29261  ORF Transcript_13601/g.29261 Transcript_13601/m.29261 type:complete len:226 (+) Transcript_13601:754-1431(+)
MKHPHRWVPRKWVIVAYTNSRANMKKKRASSCAEIFACASFFFGTLARMYWGRNFGQKLTANHMAKSMKATPMIGAITVLNMSNSPPKLNNTLKSTRERMSSTKAAVMMAWPKFSWRTPASPRRRSAMPTLVGASAVPAEIPSGMKGRPNITVKALPTISGRIVPRTATQQAGRPTILAFSKSKCIPLSKIIKPTPAWPIKVKKSGKLPQLSDTSCSRSFTKHSE